MDFSQLPKMSKTPTATPDAKPQVTEEASVMPAPHVRSATTPARASSEHFYTPPVSPFGFSSVWISLICGLLSLMFGKNFGSWLLAKVSGRPFNTGVDWMSGPNAGSPVSYFELQGGTAWSEAGLFLMGVALLLDAALIFIVLRGKRPLTPLVIAAVGLTGMAMLINAAVSVYLFSLNIIPLTSIVALLVGGMILFDHAPLLKRSPAP